MMKQWNLIKEISFGSSLASLGRRFQVEAYFRGSITWGVHSFKNSGRAKEGFGTEFLLAYFPFKEQNPRCKAKPQISGTSYIYDIQL